MSDIPEDLKYTKSHEWVRKEGDSYTIGITHHAQHLLGDIVFVELPEVGETVTQGEEFGVVESVKAASDIYAPVSGEVSSSNMDLEDSPALVNKSPYDDGWLIQLNQVDLAEIDELMTAQEYADFVSEEA